MRTAVEDYLREIRIKFYEWRMRHYWKLMQEEIRHRSVRQVARMERKKGLAE